MIVPCPGGWSHKSGRWLVWERLYHYDSENGSYPTIWCRLSFRYLHTARELSLMTISSGVITPPSPPKDETEKEKREPLEAKFKRLVLLEV